MTRYAQGDGILAVDLTPEALAEARAQFIAANPNGVTIQWDDEDEAHTYPAGEWWDSVWNPRLETIGIDHKCAPTILALSKPLTTTYLGAHHVHH